MFEASVTSAHTRNSASLSTTILGLFVFVSCFVELQFLTTDHFWASRHTNRLARTGPARARISTERPGQDTGAHGLARLGPAKNLLTVEVNSNGRTPGN